MLIRALRVSSALDEWLLLEVNSDVADLQLDEEEWSQVRYLTVLLRPFFYWTEVLSKTSGATIHLAWEAYNELFDHLERYQPVLRAKSTPWKKHLAEILLDVRAKLHEYYSRTDGKQGLIYNLATILDPAQKLELYRSSDFGREWAKIYQSQARRKYASAYQHFERPSEQEPGADAATSTASLTGLSSMRRRRRRQGPTPSEIDLYLESGVTMDEDPLGFWAAREQISPALAQMAKDIHGAPVSGAGVERAFSIGRQLCSDQRHRLDPQTIRKRLLVRQRERLLAMQDKERGLAARVSAYSNADVLIADDQHVSEDEEGDDTHVQQREPPSATDPPTVTTRVGSRQRKPSRRAQAGSS
jgi:hypothetical protein